MTLTVIGADPAGTLYYAEVEDLGSPRLRIRAQSPKAAKAVLKDWIYNEMDFANEDITDGEDDYDG